MPQHDLIYFMERLGTELAMSERAHDPRVAATHLAMAELYDAQIRTGGPVPKGHERRAADYRN